MAAGEVYIADISNRLYWTTSSNVWVYKSPSMTGAYGRAPGEIGVNALYLEGRSINTTNNARWTGSLTGLTGTPGEIWVKGDDFYYVDRDGNERKIVKT